MRRAVDGGPILGAQGLVAEERGRRRRGVMARFDKLGMTCSCGAVLVRVVAFG
jgi:hypothetical protein